MTENINCPLCNKPMVVKVYYTPIYTGFVSEPEYEKMVLDVCQPCHYVIVRERTEKTLYSSSDICSFA